MEDNFAPLGRLVPPVGRGGLVIVVVGALGGVIVQTIIVGLISGHIIAVVIKISDVHVSGALPPPVTVVPIAPAVVTSVIPPPVVPIVTAPKTASVPIPTIPIVEAVIVVAISLAVPIVPIIPSPHIFGLVKISRLASETPVIGESGHVVLDKGPIALGGNNRGVMGAPSGSGFLKAKGRVFSKVSRHLSTQLGKRDFINPHGP